MPTPANPNSTANMPTARICVGKLYGDAFKKESDAHGRRRRRHRPPSKTKAFAQSHPHQPRQTLGNRPATPTAPTAEPADQATTTRRRRAQADARHTTTTNDPVPPAMTLP